MSCFLYLVHHEYLHSDNGREFVASVIVELKNLFPDLVFIRGRPRHPQSQGCIERANGILYDALGKWMCTNDSNSWSSALLPVVYGINTRKSTLTKTTPYEVMFLLLNTAFYWTKLKFQFCLGEIKILILIATYIYSEHS